MENYHYPGTDIQTSRLALGCMRMAGKLVAEAQAVIEAALAVGINYFDHADIYGRGQSEERFAQAFKQIDCDRDQIYLQSKVGIRPKEGMFDFSKDHILKSVDGILRRLETDYLDALLLHRPDSLMEPEEVAEAFQTLKDSGKVRYFGVSNQSVGQMKLLQAATEIPLVFNQLQFGPAHTLMLDAGFNFNMPNDFGSNRTADILEYCRLHQITIQPWSPFQVDLEQGLFMKHPDYQELTKEIQEKADQYQVSFEGMVMAWILRHPAKMQPIVGTMTPERIRHNAEGLNVDLSRQDWYEIYRAGGRPLP